MKSVYSIIRYYMLLFKNFKQWLQDRRGILATTSALVYRESYFGNNVIGQNSSAISTGVDERGYVPVERWIMSTVQADNPIKKIGEGITTISLNGTQVPLSHLQEIAGALLFGEYAKQWPLTKILDIGGTPVSTSFDTTETPPIPVHVHGGTIVDGRAEKPGKSEAYFFPPTNVPPYKTEIAAITRIGLKAGVTREDVKAHLRVFGTDDSMYALLNEFPIVPMTGWTVPEGILHAPGPHVTFEIQLPQDDYNLASWRLGERLKQNERSERYQELVLRGLKDEDTLIASVLDWSATSDQNLEKKYSHESKVIEWGHWGRRLQIFFDCFYGEGWEIRPGKTMTIPPKHVPQAGIVWSGSGEINGNPISQSGQNEFLCIPNTSVTVKNTHRDIMYVYTVEPICG